MGNDQPVVHQSKPQTQSKKDKDAIQDSKYHKIYEELFLDPNLDKLNSCFKQSKKLPQGLFDLFTSVKNRSYQSFMEIVVYLIKLDVQSKINLNLADIASKTSILDRFFMLIYNAKTVKIYRNIQVTQQDKENCIFQFFTLFCTPQKKHLQKIGQSMRQFQEKEMLHEFVEKFKDYLTYSQKMIITYFTQKFANPNKDFFIFSSAPDSNLLSMEDWIILGMKNIKILKNQPTLLYSLEKNGSSFHSLYRHLIGYQGPWIFVLSHYETDTITKSLKLCIFGSFQSSTMQDLNTYQGNPEGFLFRLSPHYRVFSASDGQGESNFFKINTTEYEVSKLPRGIGFGGKNNQDYKIWIDQSIQTNSYVSNKEDPTYGFGYIAFPSTNALRVRDLQIWGLGDESSLQAREQYWLNREQEAYKRRKVNKKDLMSGGLTNILFENTFKHREQVIGEIEHKKDEQ